MKTIISVKEIQDIAVRLYKKNVTIGFIPTMGALHAGHIQLIKESKKANDITIISIFVNPKQFGPKEDLSKYPRPILGDQRLLIKEKVDYLFNPNVKEIYPLGFQTSVTVNKLYKVLEGRSRPTHFAGVSTVVLKLFNLISPTNAYFGQKDYQQCVVVKQLVNDLNLLVKIKILTTVRDKDGLALSSRNIFLNSQERTQALNLYKSLLLAKKLISSENKNVIEIKNIMKDFLKKYKLIRIDYIEICNPDNLFPLKVISKKSVILIAAYVGKIRLIDNIVV